MNARALHIVAAPIVALASCASSPPASSVKPVDPPPHEGKPAVDSCVCTLSTGELAQREKWLVTFAPGVEAVSDLPDGFEIRFKGTAEWSKKLHELVEKERACCSTLVFELRFEPEGGPILFRVRGSKEATDFLRARLAPVKATSGK